MVKMYEGGVYFVRGAGLIPEAEMEAKLEEAERKPYRDRARRGTIAWSILEAHNTSGDEEHLKLRFDSMTSHDITYVGVIQTARASGMERFPLPYVLTNCHNSLCAVGGTINEDDHVFGMSACEKYGGIFVPPHMAVMHQYMREMMAGCGKMILGSDSHTRYGALGTLGIGEGGGELVKQLLKDTYDITCPGVTAVYLDGCPRPGVGPQDIALAIIGAVFNSGYVKNKIMEFIGPGIASMTTDYRNGIDVMTTETACLSSVWETDEDTREFLAVHGRESEYKKLEPADTAWYDGAVYVDVSAIRPMIALPFHPSNAYEIDTFNRNAGDILREIEREAPRVSGNPKLEFCLTDKLIHGRLKATQGVIAGCAGGTYTNVMEAARMLKNRDCGSGYFSLSIYPSSQPVYMDLVRKGAVETLMAAGAVLRTAFCGPCFGAGDTPANNGFSIRHTTRNFPNREGSKPGQGQMAAVALMDARSIAATAANGGMLTSAEELAEGWMIPGYTFDRAAYDSRVYRGYGNARQDAELICGPNIKDWPKMSPLTDNILLRVCSKILDPVTTTDELIPSGETSSYRSNPIGLAEFTLSRRDPQYVGRAKIVNQMEKERRERSGKSAEHKELKEVFQRIRSIPGNESVEEAETEIGSVIYARRPGDGSAREQAASCQRVLGGLANICEEYATKRYRSNVINWGMLPFQTEGGADVPEVGTYLYIPGVRRLLDEGSRTFRAYVIGTNITECTLYMAELTPVEREIIKAGSLINYNKNR